MGTARKLEARHTCQRIAVVDEEIGHQNFTKLARTSWLTGAAENWPDAVKSAFVLDLQRHVLAVRSDQLVIGPLVVRAVAGDGSLVDTLS